MWCGKSSFQREHYSLTLREVQTASAEKKKKEKIFQTVQMSSPSWQWHAVGRQFEPSGYQATGGALVV